MENKKQLDFNKYNHYMIKEIFEIPTALKNTLNWWKDGEEKFSSSQKENLKDIENIYIIACGTSYHSGLIGKKILEKRLNIRCEVVLANEFVYEEIFLPKNTLCIFVSQSGETTDIIRAFENVKKHNIKTMAITNGKDSSITKLVDYTVYLCSGVEHSVASTKVYNCQILSYYILSNFLIALKEGDFAKFTNYIEEMKTKVDSVEINNFLDNQEEIAKQLVSFSHMMFLGRNYDYITAQEAALKMKETTYINSVGMASGEVRHGTMALLDERFAVCMIITDEKYEKLNGGVLADIKKNFSKTVVLSPFPKENYADIADFVVTLPKMDSELTNIFAIVPLQILAYFVSINKGNNPDLPRNLTKAVLAE